ncbi:site-specific integrase [Phycicoccus endophyticus]|uniref:Site-specific integrase n=1 Tax=Phycicoccus endophyticus TaxID=1690220 RepID=A0A7G9R3K3_9MICO|nr:site-specific integrase [Phycicoccus endophyticus]NHI19935.1 site-specific integrase [Phycicoccus endophyticus]QNN50178.1 site-specific integrase [Phycicoccus endophyticus]GGL27404.1 putative phage integrase [Phycicoccus endophyticus]
MSSTRTTRARQRRPQGSGGLFQRASDGLWVGRVDVGFDSRGRRDRRQVSAKTRAEAARKLKQLQRDIASGNIPTAGTGARTTVKSWSDAWLPQHERTVRPNVYVTDRGVVRRWIVPTIGHRRLADLTPADLRRLADAVTNAGRSSSTALNVHAVLVKMLRDARLEGHAVPDRIFDAPRPRPAASDRDQIPPAHLLAILRVIADRPDTSRWLFRMLYGVRQGEALGLTWEAIDLDAGSFTIEWQLEQFAKDATLPTWLRTRHLTGTMWLVEPKTKNRNVTLPLLPFLGASFEAYRETATPNRYGLVWTDASGEPIRDHHDRREWHAIQRAAGVAHPAGRPWHLHETRHTAASILIDEGTDPRVVAAILGQSKVVQAYVHVDAAATSKALGRLAKRLGIEA